MHLEQLVMPPDTDARLAEVGRWGGLSDREMLMDVDPNHLVDPATKLLEIVSRKAARKVHYNICHESDFIIAFTFLVD